MFDICESFVVPANGSRFFTTKPIAIKQPLGVIQLSYDQRNQILINRKFESNLISYDDVYCTSVQDFSGSYTSPTLLYIFDEIDVIQENFLVIDIGCGKGEFVTELRNRKVLAFGFDPCAPDHVDYVFKKYYMPGDMEADLFVMRCVLPHIGDPFTFIDDIFLNYPKSSILIEFQRLEYMIENNLWYQISHDHVNMFSIGDFLRYRVKKTGKFSNGEWGYVLIQQKDFKNEIPKKSVKDLLDLEKKLNKLMRIRQLFLENIVLVELPIAVWGAAGKGTVLAHAMSSVRELDIAVDVDKNKENKYMEGSGCLIISHVTALQELDPDTLILVANPNHLKQIKEFVQNKYKVELPVSIGTESGQNYF